ncbi:Zinc transporter 1 [Linum perenne]
MISLIAFSLLLLINLQSASAACNAAESSSPENEGSLLNFKFGAMASILAAGAIGVSLPLFANSVTRKKSNSAIVASDHDGGDHHHGGGGGGGGGGGMLVVKSFAGGVILATGMVHILPEAFEQLGSPCLSQVPWGKFPFAGFVAMMFAIGTLSMESLAMGFYKRRQIEKTVANDGDHEAGIDRKDDGGTSKSTKTIKPLMAALSFHQLFEGVGLGGSITQAKLKLRTRIFMAIFFSLTTPVGIGIGMAISRNYKDNSPHSLIIQGTFTSASAGILVYMALVDLLATDFMSSNMLLSDFRIQFGAYASLFLGAGSMSVLALVA